MDYQAGKAAIVYLQAAFPRFTIPDATQDTWGRMLSEEHALTLPEVTAAIDKLAHERADEHYPSLQALLAKVREVRKVTASPALPAGREIPTREAQEGRRRFTELVAGFFAGRGDDLAEARIATGTSTPEERGTLARAKAARMLEAAEVPIEAPARIGSWPGGRVPTPCAGAIGKTPVMVDGVPTCPSCGNALYGPTRAADERDPHSDSRTRG